MDDLYAESACLLHGGRGVGQHIGRVHDVFDGVVEHAAGGGEIVLVFDQDKGGSVGVHAASPVGGVITIASSQHNPHHRHRGTEPALKISAPGNRRLGFRGVR